MKKMFKLGFYGIMAAAMLFVGCNKDLKDDVDALKEQVSGIDKTLTDLSSTVKGLTDDIKAGKLITSVNANATKDGKPGVEITYSDNTTSFIYHGAAGAAGVAGKTPLVYIDAAGYWCVAPTGDKGTNDRLVPNVMAQGPAGPAGAAGAKGSVVTVAYNADNYLTISVLDPNVATEPGVNPMVTVTDIKKSNLIIEAIVDYTYYYEFNVSGKLYRIAKVNPTPQSIKVLTVGVEALKGDKAYMVISVSPSNATVSKENLKLDFAGNMHITRAAVFNGPDFLTMISVTNLKDIADQTTIGITDAITANGGEWVVEFDVIKDAPFTANTPQGSLSAGKVPAYDVMIEYPIAPASINEVVASAGAVEVTGTAYSRSVNSVYFAKKFVDVVTGMVSIVEDNATIYTDSKYEGTVNVDKTKFTHDFSYLDMIGADFTITGAKHLDADGAEQQTTLAALKALFTLAVAPAAADAEANVFRAISVTPADVADFTTAGVATGHSVVLTITAKVRDLKGGFEEKTLTITVMNVKSNVAFRTVAKQFLIPIADHVIYDDSKFSDPIMAALKSLGFTEAQVKAATTVQTGYTLTKDDVKIEAGNPDFDCVTVTPFSAADATQNMVVKTSNKINTGSYLYTAVVSIDGREVMLKARFIVHAPDYTVALKSAAIEANLVTVGTVNDVYSTLSYSVDTTINVESIIDPTKVSVSVPAFNGAPTAAPGYVFAGADVTLAGNLHGLIASPNAASAVGADIATWNTPQTVKLNIKLATGQEIPVQVVKASDATALVGIKGDLNIAIAQNSITNLVATSPATAYVFNDCKTTAQDISTAFTSAEFKTRIGNTISKVTTYADLVTCKMVGLNNIKFELDGIVVPGTPMQVENLIEITKTATAVTFKTVGNVTRWNGVAIQKVKLTVSDVWGNKRVANIEIKITNNLIP